MATIKTNDGTFMNISNKLLRECKVLYMMMPEDLPGVIPLPIINTPVFLNVLKFSESGRLVNYDMARDVILAADYLNYTELVDHCAEYIAKYIIKGKTVKEIREYFVA
jgi:hypothetical protein